LNYRASCRARSKREFTAKIGQVEEEADECVGWLEFIRDKRLLPAADIDRELEEARQLTAIFTASHRTARCGRRRPSAETGAHAGPRGGPADR
jgi:four helix bundle protein